MLFNQLPVESLISFCVFPFKRMDLGECTKIHDLALRADYEIASKERDLFFELDVSDGLLPQWCFVQVC